MNASSIQHGRSSTAKRMLAAIIFAASACGTALYALPCCDSDTVYYDVDFRQDPNATEVGEHILTCDGSQDNWGVHSNYASVTETSCSTGAMTGQYCIIDGNETIC